MNNILSTVKWDKRFMRIAREVSSWSKDPSTKVGAVIVNQDRNIISTGYNGFPRGIEDSIDRLEDREEKYPRIVHGEMNALLNALYNGVSVKGATIYVWGLPVCSECTKSIIQAGISRVVITDIKDTKWKESWEKHSQSMLSEACVWIDTIEENSLD